MPAEALVDAGLQRCEPGAPGSASSPRFWAVGAKKFARNRTSPGLGVGDAGDESVAGGVHGRSALFGEGDALFSLQCRGDDVGGSVRAIDQAGGYLDRRVNKLRVPGTQNVCVRDFHEG